MPAKTAKQRRFLQAVAGGAKPRKGSITPAQARKALGEGETRRTARKGKKGK